MKHHKEIVIVEDLGVQWLPYTDGGWQEPFSNMANFHVFIDSEGVRHTELESQMSHPSHYVGEVIRGERDEWIIDGSERIKIERGDKLPDQAMLQTPAQLNAKDKAALAKNPGVIDLNQINVKRTGETVNVQFDPAQLNELMQGGFEGFTPVIINITHISSPFQLLGINPAKE